MKFTITVQNLDFPGSPPRFRARLLFEDQRPQTTAIESPIGQTTTNLFYLIRDAAIVCAFRHAEQSGKPWNPPVWVKLYFSGVACAPATAFGNSAAP